jgi:hypothetical protein
LRREFIARAIVEALTVSLFSLKTTLVAGIGLGAWEPAAFFCSVPLTPVLR